MKNTLQSKLIKTKYCNPKYRETSTVVKALVQQKVKNTVYLNPKYLGILVTLGVKKLLFLFSLFAYQ